MKRIFYILIILSLAGPGCVALHYSNIKGFGAKAKDVQVKAAKVEKGKVDFTSTMDLWIFFPWKFNTEEKTSMDNWE